MKQKVPEFYECGCCGMMHNNAWHGDCRQDNARFTIEDIEAKHGPEEAGGWREVPMDGDAEEVA